MHLSIVSSYPPSQGNIWGIVGNLTDCSNSWLSPKGVYGWKIESQIPTIPHHIAWEGEMGWHIDVHNEQHAKVALSKPACRD